MPTKGDKSRLKTFIQTSLVISDLTPELKPKTNGGFQDENETRKNVQIGIIPLQWIIREGDSLANLY